MAMMILSLDERKQYPRENDSPSEGDSSLDEENHVLSKSRSVERDIHLKLNQTKVWLHV